MNDIVSLLIERGNYLIGQPHKYVEFTHNPGADDLLNNLEKYPHAFVLACIMDRQIKAERAWLIPYEIKSEIGTFILTELSGITLEMINNIFKTKQLHRFNEMMANYFYLGIKRIHKIYQDDASNIWKGFPKSATIVRRFLEFEGVGIKIASMAVNSLARDFKIGMADKICIDISPDVHVKRVFTRLGLITKNATNEELIFCARELNPEYPGVFDLSAWEIGRQWCRPKYPKCNECSLNKWCYKIGVD